MQDFFFNHGITASDEPGIQDLGFREKNAAKF